MIEPEVGKWKCHRNDPVLVKILEDKLMDALQVGHDAPMGLKTPY